MTGQAADKGTKPAPDTPDPAAETTPAPGSPGWVPGRPDKRIDRGRGPSCPYRLGY